MCDGAIDIFYLWTGRTDFVRIGKGQFYRWVHLNSEDVTLLWICISVPRCTSCRSTCGARTTWSAPSTSRTPRAERPARSPSSTSCPGLTAPSPSRPSRCSSSGGKSWAMSCLCCSASNISCYLTISMASIERELLKTQWYYKVFIYNNIYRIAYDLYVSSIDHLF